MIKPIIAGNWKMNKTPQEGHSFVEKWNDLLLDVEQVQVIFCPPFPALFYINEVIKDSRFALGAQHCHWETKGAFTGEVSPQMLVTCGVDYVITGHSERRHVFNETNKWINRKVRAILKAGMRPILCVGETLTARNVGRMQTVLENQLTTGLSGVESLENLVLAYEPVWAIGTGINASSEQVAEAHQMVRKWLINLFSKTEAEEVSILYGGSVTPANADELIRTKGVDGFLIGGASLDVDQFHAIVRSVVKNYVRN